MECMLSNLEIIYTLQPLRVLELSPWHPLMVQNYPLGNHITVFKIKEP
jgi:hypothetical protein